MPLPSTAARAALALLLALPLAGCGGGEATPSGERPVLVEPDDLDVADAVDDPTVPRLVNVVLTDGELTGDTGVVEVARNVPVRLVVISDRTDTLVVQGYDLEALATAEVPVQLDFVASRSGEFPVLLREADVVLTRLRVR